MVTAPPTFLNFPNQEGNSPKKYNPDTQEYDIAVARVAHPRFQLNEYAKPIRLAKANSFKTNVLGQLGGWSEVTHLQMSQYMTGCNFAPGMQSTHFCATPSESEWCTPFSAWEMVNNVELAGIIGEESYENGNLAKDACIQEPFCTGVGFAGKGL